MLVSLSGCASDPTSLLPSLLRAPFRPFLLLPRFLPGARLSLSPAALLLSARRAPIRPFPRNPNFAAFPLPQMPLTAPNEIPVPLLCSTWFSPFPQVSSAIRPCTPVHLPPPANVRPQRRPCPRPESSRFPQPCPVHRSPHRSTYVQLAPKPRKPIPYPLLPDTLTPWTPYA